MVGDSQNNCWASEGVQWRGKWLWLLSVSVHTTSHKLCHTHPSLEFRPKPILLDPVNSTMVVLTDCQRGQGSEMGQRVRGRAVTIFEAII